MLHRHRRLLGSVRYRDCWCLHFRSSPLPLFKPNVSVDYGLFLGMCLYLALLQQHSIFCNYIISMNEIPYMCGYIAAAALGTVLVCLMCVFSIWALGELFWVRPSPKLFTTIGSGLCIFAIN